MAFDSFPCTYDSSLSSFGGYVALIIIIIISIFQKLSTANSLHDLLISSLHTFFFLLCCSDNPPWFSCEKHSNRIGWRYCKDLGFWPGQRCLRKKCILTKRKCKMATIVCFWGHRPLIPAALSSPEKYKWQFLDIWLTMFLLKFWPRISTMGYMEKIHLIRAYDF